VEFTSFPLSEASTDLKYLGVTGGEKSLHAQFRRRMEEPTPDTNGINVGFGGRGGDYAGGIDLKITLFNEKPPYGLDNPGAQPEVLFPGS